MRRTGVFGLLLIVIFLLPSCGSATDSKVSTGIEEHTTPDGTIPFTNTETNIESGYPSQENNIVVGYPGPEGYPGPTSNDIIVDLPMEMVDPLPPGPGFATVTGVLKLDFEGEIKPVSGMILFLGEVKYLADGSPALSAVDKQTAPSALTSGVGQFSFENVTPGQYTLVIDKITQTFVLHNPNGGNLILDAQPDSILDIGDLTYAELPIDIKELP